MADDKKRAKLGDFPPSSDKEFWGEDAELYQINTNEPEEEFKPLEGHEWRQQGPAIICRSCPLPHSVRIGINKELRQVNGKLKITKRH